MMSTSLKKRLTTAVSLVVLILSSVTACFLLNSPPVASFSAFPNSGSAPLVVTFDASSSSDSDGIIAAYRWEFGDGTTAAGKTQTHTYDLPGAYTVVLTITNNDGEEALASQVIQVGQAAITASFVANPTSGEQPLSVDFDASASVDQEGQSITHTWSFGDGSTGTGEVTRHTYYTAGIYVVRLTVSNENGDEDQATATIAVSGAPSPGNTTPIASFTASPPSGGAPLAVSFNASGSSDPDGSIAYYAWAFGDGGSSTGVATNHTYNTVGTYTAQLMVMDDDGATDAVIQTIQVSAIPASNSSPTASFTASPPSGGVPLAVSFNASGSSDPDGSIVSCDWTFGDGGSSSGITANHIYNTVGTYTAQLTVTDDDGSTDSTTQVITVTAAAPGDNNPPTASFTASPPSGGAPLAVSFNASGSSDPDGLIVSYAWTFGDSESASGVTTNHTYPVGTYTAQLTVTDNGGATDTATITISAEAHIPSGAAWTLNAAHSEGGGLSVISMATASDGWAVGGWGRIYHYDGTSWTLHTTSPGGYSIEDIDMVTASDGWAVNGVGRFYHFSGASWTLHTTTAEGSRLRGIDMVTANDGWAAGNYGRIYRFNGTSWTLHTTTPEGSHLSAIDMATANDGWAIGSYGRIYHYDGERWTLHTTTPEGSRLYAINMVTVSDGWACGGHSSESPHVPAGRIYHYDGESWTLQTTTAEESALWGIDMVTVSDGWAVGNAGIYRFNGTSWTLQTTRPEGRPLSAIDMVTASDGWAVGTDGWFYRGTP